jgi:peptide/nickel transport system substrate-binding protein
MHKRIQGQRRAITLLILILTLGLLAGCAGTPEGDDAASKQGGKLIVGMYQEPGTLNVGICSQTVCFEVNEFVNDALVEINPQGEYVPQLATELPSLENGGISEDGLTITYHLRDDIKWADGEPCECDDWKYTWEVINDPDSGIRSTTGWRDIEAVECPDPQTIVFKFSQYFAPHFQIVGGAWVYPRHATGDPADLQSWDYNRAPLGNGPFQIQEWVSGDHITLTDNEYYYLADDGKPYLDEIIIQFVPSREVGKQLIRTGAVDILWDLIEADIPEFEDTEGIILSAIPDTGTERLLLNLRDPTIDAPCKDELVEEGLWHWALGDVRVRKAIRYGVDKAMINEKLLYGKATLGSAEINMGWAKPDIPVSEYDPDAARELLDEAGWQDTDGDGIRECVDCLYAEDGRKLRLEIKTTSGNELRERVEQVLIEMMQDIGIELYIENDPSSELFGSYAQGAARRHGQFDILMYTTSFRPDPQSQMENYYASWNIPCDDNNGRGANYHRWINKEYDELITFAGQSPDLAERKEAYQKASELIHEEVPAIYLYDRLEMNAYRDLLQGWVDNNWQDIGWNSDEWWLEPTE